MQTIFFFWILRGRRTICCHFQEHFLPLKYYISWILKPRQLIWYTLKQHSSTFIFWPPYDPILMTLWGHFEKPYFRMLNDSSVASAGSSLRTCRRIKNSKKIASICDFHLSICINQTILPEGVRPPPLFREGCFLPMKVASLTPRSIRLCSL